MFQQIKKAFVGLLLFGSFVGLAQAEIIASTYVANGYITAGMVGGTACNPNYLPIYGASLEEIHSRWTQAWFSCYKDYTLYHNDLVTNTGCNPAGWIVYDGVHNGVSGSYFNNNQTIGCASYRECPSTGKWTLSSDKQTCTGCWDSSQVLDQNNACVNSKDKDVGPDCTQSNNNNPSFWSH